MATKKFDIKKSWNAALFILIALALLGGGLSGLIGRFQTGHEQVGYGSNVPWGLWVAIYVYLVWLEVGSVLIFTTLHYVFDFKSLKAIKGLAYLTAFTTLAPALMLIGLDLGHPFRFMNTITSPNFGSFMAWMIWLHLIYLVFLLVKLALVVLANRSRKPERLNKALKVLALLSLPVGVALLGTVGSIFGANSARSFWQMSALPLYFLIFALVAGSGLVTALFVCFAPKSEESYAATAGNLGKLTLALLIFGAMASAFSGLISLNSNAPAQANAIQMIVAGPQQWTFWALYIGLGVLVPSILLFVWPKATRVIGIAASLVFVSFAAVPFNIIIAGQTADTLTDADAFTGFGLQLGYAPTMLEWQVVAFALGVGLAIFLTGYYLLPMRKLEMEG